jgi:pimeloyl-ACP methyl ester carboxylesterase
VARVSWRRSVIGGLALMMAGAVILFVMPPVLAGALLRPSRSVTTMAAPSGCVDATLAGDGVQLRGWTCSAIGPRRGAVVYLHGVADNRGSAAGVASTLPARGFDVVAYDSRAHGASEGAACTYGYYEKRDLMRVTDALAPGPVVLIGVSLGAAVALQTAAIDRRTVAVVAAEVFSDLRTVALERAPFFVDRWTAGRAFTVAERDARFRVGDVDVVASARQLSVPVLLIHGDEDDLTSPQHSARVLAALQGHKRLRLVNGARHNESLQTPAVWNEIYEWIDGAVK